MMDVLDALTLARTKLRSHRVRTGITVAMAGLLFGLIIAALLFVQGIFTSVDKYSEVGLNNRVLLNVGHYAYASYFDTYSHSTDQDFVREVEKIHKEEVAKKQAAAKKYSVPYNSETQDPSPIIIDPITKQKIISNEGLGSNAVQRAAQLRQDASTKPFSLDEYLKSYKSTTRRGTTDAVRPTNGSLTYMKEGKENQKVSSNPFEDGMISNGSGASLTVLDASVSAPFVTNTSFDPLKGEVPVILPFSDAEKLLGLTKLTKDATPNERRERLAYVRDNVGTVTAAFCYRSNASRTLMGQALAQQDILKRMAGDASFETPSLLYSPPNLSDCSGVSVKSDTRSAAEKQAEANRVLFEKELGMWIGEATQRKIIVRGVGVSGDATTSAAAISPALLVTGLLNSTLGYNTWMVPEGLFEQLPASAKPSEVFGKEAAVWSSLEFSLPEPHSYLVEFGDKKEARALLERTGAFTGGSGGDVVAYPFGSGTLFVDELRTWTERVLLWALLAVGAVAVITLWGVIGRTIADSRRESAVFRAIGATRLDVAGIYSLYAFLLSLRVVVFAVLLGLTLAIVVDLIFSEGATVAAQLAYAAVDTDIQFRLFDLFSWYVPVVLGAIILVGLLASIVPIALGVRRNPINDMRDDG